MSKKQKRIRLLIESIEHWEEILDNAILSNISEIEFEEFGDIYPDGNNCPLCKVYANQYKDDPDCEYCPIRMYTNQYACKETPYYMVYRMLNQGDIVRNETIEAIKGEVKFLYKVLNKELNDE